MAGEESLRTRRTAGRVPAFGVRVLVEDDGRRDERRCDARDDDRRHRPGRAGVGVLEQRDSLQDRRWDALEDALDDFANEHRAHWTGRRARVALCSARETPYLNAGSHAEHIDEYRAQHDGWH